jgi:hypothetical protein
MIRAEGGLPEAAAGPAAEASRRLRTVRDSDGAPSRCLKRYAVATTASKRFGTFSLGKRPGAVAAGITPEQVSGALSTLVRVKGIGAGRDVFIDLGIASRAAAAEDTAGSGTPQDIGRYFRDYVGDRPRHTPPRLTSSTSARCASTATLPTWSARRQSACGDGGGTIALRRVRDRLSVRRRDGAGAGEPSRDAQRTPSWLRRCSGPPAQRGCPASAGVGEAILQSRPSTDGAGGEQE